MSVTSDLFTFMVEKKISAGERLRGQQAIEISRDSDSTVASSIANQSATAVFPSMPALDTLASSAVLVVFLVVVALLMVAAIPFLIWLLCGFCDYLIHWIAKLPLFSKRPGHEPLRCKVFRFGLVRGLIGLVRWTGNSAAVSLWAAVLLGLGGIWAFFGIIVYTAYFPDDLAGALYAMFLTLGPNGLLSTPSEAGLGQDIRSIHYLGLVGFIWLTALPVLRFLVSGVEGWIVRLCAADHCVIIGGGQAGASLAREQLSSSKGRRVVVLIDPNASSGQLENLRRLGCIFIDADAADTAVLKLTGLHRARGVFIATGVDSQNLDIAGRVAELIADAGATAFGPIIVPHVNDRVLRERLDANERLFGDGERRNIRPFSSEDLAVRLLMMGAEQGRSSKGRKSYDETFSRYARLMDLDRVHAVILGGAPLSDTLTLSLLQQGLSAGLQPPKITIVVDERRECPKAARASFVHRHPELVSRIAPNEPTDDAWQIRFTGYNFGEIAHDLFDKAYVSEASRREEERLIEWLDKESAPDRELADGYPVSDGVSSVFICLGDDNENLSAGIAVRALSARSGRWRAPLFLRLQGDAGLRDVLRAPEDETELGSVVHDFGRDEDVCAGAYIFDQKGKRAAWAVHSIYMFNGVEGAERALIEQIKPEPDPKHLEELINKYADSSRRLPRNSENQKGISWRDLGKTFAKSNYDQAVHAFTKLEGLGYSVVRGGANEGDDRSVRGAGFSSLKNARADLEALRGSPQESYEHLAELEHERFMVERHAVGWRQGAERDNMRRVHTTLKPYEELPTSEKDKDRNTVLHLPYIARHLDNRAVWRPEVVIGLIGLGDGMLPGEIDDELERELQAHADHHSHCMGLTGRRRTRVEDLQPVILSGLFPGLDMDLARKVFEALSKKAGEADRPPPRFLWPRVLFADTRSRLAEPDDMRWKDQLAETLKSLAQKDNTAKQAFTHYRTERSSYLEGFNREDWPANPGWIIDLIPPGITPLHLQFDQNAADKKFLRRHRFRSAQLSSLSQYITRKSDIRLTYEEGTRSRDDYDRQSKDRIT